MSGLYILRTDKKRLQALLIALALILVMAVVAVQSAWADHASDHHKSQFEIVAPKNQATALSSSASIAASCSASSAVGTSGLGAFETTCDHCSTRLALYEDGALEFHAPGR